MAQEIQVVELETVFALFIHREARQDQLGTVFGECWPQVFAYAIENGIEIAGAPFARYHGFEEGNLSVDIGIPIAAPANGKADIQYGEIPGGTHVSTIHQGPYDDLHRAHSAIEGWLADNDRSAAGPNWESYITDPEEVPSPADWETAVFWPIA